MRPEEIQFLCKLVKDGMERPLSAADMRLLFRLHQALQDYDRQLRFEPDSGERRCGICGVPVSQCCC